MTHPSASTAGAPLCPRCKTNRLADGDGLCGDCVMAEREADDGGHAPAAAPAPAAARRGQPSSGPARQPPQRQAEPHPNAPPAEPARPPQQERPSSGRTAHPDQARPNGAQAIDKGKAAAPKPAGAAPVGFTPNVGLKRSPEKLVIYGPGGVGKTSILVAIPDVFLIAMESTPGLTVPRADEDKAPRTLQQFIAIIRWLKTAEHPYKALAIDSADELERLVFAAAVARANERREDASGLGPAENIEHVGGGYKKGYTAAATRWNEVLAELEQLRLGRGMQIVFSAHEVTTKKNNPQGDDFDQYNLNLHPEAGRPLLIHWADAVLFYNYVSIVQRQGKGGRGKAKGVGGKLRGIWTQNADGAYAKNRYDMPERMDVTGSGEDAWGAIAWAIEQWASPKLLQKAIDDALAIVGDMLIDVKGEQFRLADLVAQQLGANPSRQKLAQVKNRLEARVAEHEAAVEAEAEQAAATGQGGGA
jgi:hypothetical protein